VAGGGSVPKKGKSACGVYLPDLEHARPPDLPPGMVKLPLVKGDRYKMSRKVTYVELIEDNDCWQLTFKDGLVQFIQIDFRLGLFLSDGNKLWHLYIEQSCHLMSNYRYLILASNNSSNLAPDIPLLTLT
jgi:hypothetical protein